MKHFGISHCLIALLTVACAAPAARGIAAELSLRGAFIKLKRDIEVPARGSGAIARLNVEKGTQVQQGAVIGLLDPNEAQANLAFAKAQYDSAAHQAQSDVALQIAVAQAEVDQAEYDSAEKANRRTPGSFSETEVRRLKFRAEARQLQIREEKVNMQVAKYGAAARAAEVTAAEGRLEQRQIIAPLNGVVVDIARHDGEYLREGDTVLRIVQMDTLRAGGFLNLKTDGRAPLLGRAASITFDVDRGRTETLYGKVSYVSPVPLQDGDYHVEVEFENRYDNGMWLALPEQPADVVILDRMAR
jgi:multidrug resistance efflux pump